ncbi:MAG TPA: hypothetical protein VF772_04535 [Terriglobales bacterium]
MQVGDTVVFTGTVKDRVVSKDPPNLVSILTGAADLANPTASDGKEYWFAEGHLKGVPSQSELEAMATAAGFKLEKIQPPATAAPAAKK